MIDAVVSHHVNTFRSGVARFNELLAERLGVPFVALRDAGALRAPLLSFKVSELGADDEAALERSLTGWEYDVFLHEFRGAPLERRLVAGARRVLCGNGELAGLVAGEGDGRVQTLWTPGLIVEQRRIAPCEVVVFSFGMAHKVRTEQFRRLRELLEASGRSYAVHVSAANHETATVRDAELVFAEMERIFDGRLYFLGQLSDLAVLRELERATFFAAFFDPAVRANNTTVASAMERGAVVVTNLDAASPPELRHGENVIDLEQATELPFDPLALRRLSVRAMETGRARGWEQLVARVRE